jgi:hypothetical protein
VTGAEAVHVAAARRRLEAAGGGYEGLSVLVVFAKERGPAAP